MLHWGYTRPGQRENTSVSISAVMEGFRPWQKRIWLGKLFC
jgi:hypothetical protein